jgi:predicted RNA-binding protein YlxR (DUF448 family)/ribosomal protein L30E
METELQQDESVSGGMRVRRCIATGQIMPEARLVRFVLDSQGSIVPDVEAKLPGRGYWISADRSAIERVVTRRLFAKAAGKDVNASADLAARTEIGLVRRMLSYLGLARRCGDLVLGFDRIERQIRGTEPPAVIIEASDAGADGRKKLHAAAKAAGYIPFVIGAFSNGELSLSLGRENVVHAAVKPGRIAERLIFEAARLKGFRLLNPWVWDGFSGG